MIAVIRIAGRCKLRKEVIETFKRLKLGKKFSCILVSEDDKIRMGMVKALEDYVAYGTIDEKLEKALKEKRGKGKDVYFLHPPIGGFKKSSKVPAPKGILRKHEDIGKLLERML